MKAILAVILGVVVLIGLMGQSMGTGNFVEQVLEYRPGVSEYELESGRIVENSEVIISEADTLVFGQDYYLDYKAGILEITRSLSTQYLQISYLKIPQEIKTTAQLYRQYASPDSLPEIGSIRNRFIIQNDGSLELTGSKTFALSFTDEASFDLKQSLYVKLSGSLSPNLNILAQLSDSQSKLSPEGDSRELSTLDQVFVRVYGKQYELAMGDLDWQSAKTGYLDYQGKFEGIKASHDGVFGLEAGYSAASGKNAVMQIEIVEGKLGPYYLNAQGYQSSYLIVAGSEAIYLDGALLERGTDYYIDYSEGTVMFRRLVIPGNTVVAYYQYTDENYKQNTIFNSFRYEVLPGLQIKQNLIVQRDDSAYPLLEEFTDADLDSLRLAGDGQVWGEGVFETDQGAGQYIQRSTGDGILYYEYAPGDSLASYNLRFSFVGFGNGDYEQFSSGKYVYRGQGMGSWLPQKALIAPVSRNNINTSVSYEAEAFSLGMEALLSNNDRNTLSSLDDDDNQSLIYKIAASLRPNLAALKPELSVSFEDRGANAYFFAKQTALATEVDLAGAASPDSLARKQLDIGLKVDLLSFWQANMSYLYRDTKDSFVQQGFRFQSRNKAWGFLPSTNLRATLSRQNYRDEDIPNSDLYYFLMNNLWQWKKLELKLDLLANGMDYERGDDLPLMPGSLYLKANPSLGIVSSGAYSGTISWVVDQRSLQLEDWQKQSSSQVLSLRQVYSSPTHSLDLDYSHRNVENTADQTNPRSYYDLIRYRSNHRFLKDAINLIATYQLNQTEFFPRIRELEYVGFGLGLYDSTGVYQNGGDYDYTYITSDVGQTSTELTGQMNLFLKPGIYFKDGLSRRIQSDLSLSAIELTGRSNQIGAYFFHPDYVFDPQTSIYAKQSIFQNLWLDLWQNRLIMKASWEIDRSLDQRYQELSRTYLEAQILQWELRNPGGNNYSLKLSSNQENDSRYQSEISLKEVLVGWQRNFSPQSAWDIALGLSGEQGQHSQTNMDYQSTAYTLNQSIRTVYRSKLRLSSKLGFRYNQRQGSDYLVFLPQKRAGFSSTWSVSAIYRINSYSTASLEYTGNIYPDQDSKHQLKLEFKAEL